MKFTQHGERVLLLFDLASNNRMVSFMWYLKAYEILKIPFVCIYAHIHTYMDTVGSSCVVIYFYK